MSVSRHKQLGTKKPYCVMASAITLGAFLFNTAFCDTYGVSGVRVDYSAKASQLRSQATKRTPAEVRLQRAVRGAMKMSESLPGGPRHTRTMHNANAPSRGKSQALSILVSVGLSVVSIGCMTEHRAKTILSETPTSEYFKRHVGEVRVDILNPFLLFFDGYVPFTPEAPVWLSPLATVEIVWHESMHSFEVKLMHRNERAWDLFFLDLHKGDRKADKKYPGLALLIPLYLYQTIPVGKIQIPLPIKEIPVPGRPNIESLISHREEVAELFVALMKGTERKNDPDFMRRLECVRKLVEGVYEGRAEPKIANIIIKEITTEGDDVVERLADRAYVRQKEVMVISAIIEELLKKAGEGDGFVERLTKKAYERQKEVMVINRVIEGLLSGAGGKENLAERLAKGVDKSQEELNTINAIIERLLKKTEEEKNLVEELTRKAYERQEEVNTINAIIERLRKETEEENDNNRGLPGRAYERREGAGTISSVLEELMKGNNGDLLISSSA